jgi:phosphoglycolate phosphatase
VEERSVPRPRFVVFDLDGTLVDSQAGILRSFHATLRDRGRSASDGELLHLIGPPLGQSFARLGFAGDEIDEVVALYRRYYDQEGVDLCHLYDGVEEMLEALGDNGVRLGVATAKRVDFATRMLANLGVRRFFACVSGVSLDGRLTTKREVVGDALGLLGEPEGHGGWMVGDRREDVLAALAHDLIPVGALWGYGSRDELSESGARVLAASPREMLRLMSD